MEAKLKSGTTVTSHNSTANIWGVRNNGSTRMLLKANGNQHTFGGISSGEASTTVGSLSLHNATNAFKTTIQGGVQTTADYTYTLPTADGTSGQVLSTDGSGVLSFASAGGGGGTGNQVFSGNTITLSGQTTAWATIAQQAGDVAKNLVQICADNFYICNSSAAQAMRFLGGGTEFMMWSGDPVNTGLRIRNDATNGRISIETTTAPIDLSTDTNIVFSNNTQETVRMTNLRKISTGGETNPDCSPFGMTFKTQDSGLDKAITFKNNQINHTITAVAEASTYGYMGKQHASDGGMLLRGISEQKTGIQVEANTMVEDTSDDTNSNAAIAMVAAFKEGTSTGDHQAGANLFAVKNNATTRLIVKGNGDLHVVNTTLQALDDEDDIALARNLQLVTGGEAYKHRVSEKDYKTLVKVKALSSEGDFQIMQGMSAITLGAVSQISNVLGYIGNELGIDRKQMLKQARNYDYNLVDNNDVIPAKRSRMQEMEDRMNAMVKIEDQQDTINKQQSIIEAMMKRLDALEQK
jgi:hypothetical protein